LSGITVIVASSGNVYSVPGGTSWTPHRSADGQVSSVEISGKRAEGGAVQGLAVFGFPEAVFLDGEAHVMVAAAPEEEESAPAAKSGSWA
jgi:hypothetical protein